MCTHTHFLCLSPSLTEPRLSCLHLTTTWPSTPWSGHQGPILSSDVGGQVVSDQATAFTSAVEPDMPGTTTPYICPSGRWGCDIAYSNNRLPTHITPEIQRTPLHEIVLTIKLLSLGEVNGFLAKALEPPPQVQRSRIKEHPLSTSITTTDSEIKGL